jgi:hypothetical protein
LQQLARELRRHSRRSIIIGKKCHGSVKQYQPTAAFSTTTVHERLRLYAYGAAR